MGVVGSSPGEGDAAQPMIDWINAAPPAELAPELMAAFGPDAPRRVPRLAVADLSDWMFRRYPKQTGFVVQARPVRESIYEAVQLLEHSELVYIRWTSDNECSWSATRFGLTTLANGKAAVRQRIKDRTGF
ncbi:hypothetical protein [Mycobacterium kubicae]|uniref:hypothetical protein n=1 Tax=Mycobacterium kubicae TaxID=120959 RepID=UPI000ACD8067|nr:hypothetical protein [Mycobacterium kubicae]